MLTKTTSSQCLFFILKCIIQNEKNATNYIEKQIIRGKVMWKLWKLFILLFVASLRPNGGIDSLVTIPSFSFWTVWETKLHIADGNFVSQSWNKLKVISKSLYVIKLLYCDLVQGWTYWHNAGELLKCFIISCNDLGCIISFVYLHIMKLRICVEGYTIIGVNMYWLYYNAVRLNIKMHTHTHIVMHAHTYTERGRQETIIA